MRTFKNEGTKKAFFDGARAMMRAFELANPADYVQMLSGKNERHITAVLLQADKADREIRLRDIEALLDLGKWDKDEAYAFIVGEGSNPPFKVFTSRDEGAAFAVLVPDDDLAVYAVIAKLVECGDTKFIADHITASDLSDERKAELLDVLCKATWTFLPHGASDALLRAGCKYGNCRPPRTGFNELQKQLMRGMATDGDEVLDNSGNAVKMPNIVGTVNLEPNDPRYGECQ